MLAPDVVVPADAEDAVLTALHALIDRYPPGTQMPPESTGKLAGAGRIDATSERVNTRVAAYFRHITKVVGRELAPRLLASGVITPSAGLHVASSHMAAVVAPGAPALSQWRDWAAQASADLRERHTAPTLVLPAAVGGGVYLFRTAEAEELEPRIFQVGQATVTSGDLVVPIPPTRQAGAPVMRLGPCRMLPQWLREALMRDGLPETVEAQAS
ncbi:hypothetical protein [Mycolicibacterium sp.]|uniref:hypothetical protein n=1 Tax=Mycolicibacterium sp. TaxID=2320850 RepID=UPI0035660C53